MKYLMILVIALSGCASAPSEYNQGCRDGISKVTPFEDLSRYENDRNALCNDLDKLHSQEKKDAPHEHSGR